FPEAREATLETLSGAPRPVIPWADFSSALPDARFQLVSLVAGEPYGTTRIYARVTGRADDRPMPLVSVYDAAHGRWLRRTGPGRGLPIAKTPPATVRIGTTENTKPLAARNTVVTSLPEGAYLLRVSVSTGSNLSQLRMITVTTPDQLTQVFDQNGPHGQFVS